MSANISVSKDAIQCLRGHLDAANEIFNSLGIGSGAGAPLSAAPKPIKKKETKSDRVDKYSELISKPKAKKPDHLKK